MYKSSCSDNFHLQLTLFLHHTNLDVTWETDEDEKKMIGLVPQEDINEKDFKKHSMYYRATCVVRKYDSQVFMVVTTHSTYKNMYQCS